MRQHIADASEKRKSHAALKTIKLRNYAKHSNDMAGDARCLISSVRCIIATLALVV